MIGISLENSLICIASFPGHEIKPEPFRQVTIAQFCRTPSSTMRSISGWREPADLPWCRYGDDGLIHCRSEQEAQALKAELQARFAECRLELHPTKTKIVHCKDGT